MSSERAPTATQQPPRRYVTVGPAPTPRPAHAGAEGTVSTAGGAAAAVAAADAGWGSEAAGGTEQLVVNENELVEDLRHYVAQVYAIVKPVMLCIVMVVWWVKVDQSARVPDNISTTSSVLGFGAQLYSDPATATAGEIFSQAVVNALIIVAVLIAVTIIFVVLFYYGFHRFLYGYLMLSTAAAYSVTAGLLIWDQTAAVNISIDYVTIAFCLWNFAVVGLCSIFWRGPLYVQQFYLIAISALIAWALTQIDQWTTWVLLALLVLWDLVAVLTPCGPLRVLIESSQRQNVQIPALLYSVTMIYFMADMDPPANGTSGKRGSGEGGKRGSGDGGRRSTERQRSSLGTSGTTPAGKDGGQATSAATPLLAPLASTAPLDEADGQGPASIAGVDAPASGAAEAEGRRDGAEGDEDDDERTGLKLGLGDFVFYSVLVARAALSDWTSLAACIVGVLFGLTATILMLAIYRRALPALPISLSIGIVFYFVTSLVVSPFVVRLARSSVHV